MLWLKGLTKKSGNRVKRSMSISLQQARRRVDLDPPLLKINFGDYLLHRGEE
jgi:hypothetical protein